MPLNYKNIIISGHMKVCWFPFLKYFAANYCIFNDSFFLIKDRVQIWIGSMIIYIMELVRSLIFITRSLWTVIQHTVLCHNCTLVIGEFISQVRWDDRQNLWYKIMIKIYMKRIIDWNANTWDLKIGEIET